MKRPDEPDEPRDQQTGTPEGGARTTGGGAEDAGGPEEGTGGASRATAQNGAARSPEGEQPAEPAPSADGDQDGAAQDKAAVPEAPGGGDRDDQSTAVDTAASASSGAVEGAGAVVSAGLGVVSLTGSWLGTVAGARESLIGGIQTAKESDAARRLQEVYGDEWHAIALVGGIFALLAMVVGVVVLARPAFGAPDQQQAPWIKSVAWGGLLLGLIGLLLAVLKYSDAILAVPSVSS